MLQAFVMSCCACWHGTCRRISSLPMCQIPRCMLASSELEHIWLQSSVPSSPFCFPTTLVRGPLASSQRLSGKKGLQPEELEIPGELHVERSMPVRLPECAEYVSECSVRLVQDSLAQCLSPLVVK